MSGHAFKLCPALGLGAAELLLDGEVRSFDWTPFRYGRFDRAQRARARHGHRLTRGQRPARGRHRPERTGMC